MDIATEFHGGFEVQVEKLCIYLEMGLGGSPSHLARNPVPLQSEQHIDRSL